MAVSGPLDPAASAAPVRFTSNAHSAQPAVRITATAWKLESECGIHCTSCFIIVMSS